MTTTTLTPAAADLLLSLPRKVRTCEAIYSVACALSREGMVTLSERTVLGNGQVRYTVSRAREKCWAVELAS